MELYSCKMLLRMAAVLWGLLLLLQLPKSSVSGVLIQSKYCGTDHFRYFSNFGHELFYVNGELVNKGLFYEALKLYRENDCVVPGSGLDLSSDELHLNGRRKVLQKVVAEGSSEDHFSLENQPSKVEVVHESPITPKRLAVAIPGIFVLCCCFLCPCFRTRTKEMERHVLAKDPNSMDSASSLELNSVSEKIPGSPLRGPGSPFRVPPSPSRFTMSPKLNRIGSVHLSMTQVAKATHNFSPSLKIGEGGFGTVYKAQLLDGQVVAIKRAKKEHFESMRTEFSSEVELLAKIDHRNLVRLLGYVDKGNERLIITEYVPNGTLREHLDGVRGKILDFRQRLEISIDVAHGLTYLHHYAERQIIHRDVKSSNILLTESMRAKVADFGFARVGEVDSDKTHVLTKVKGTVGYIDPDYMRTYQLTLKSDVYSFGILLLEILTARRPVELKRPMDERVTLRWAFKNYDEGNVMEMVDPLMQEVVDEDILMKMFGLAILCAAPTRADRPDMKAVVERLWAIRMDYLRNGRKG